MTESQYNEVVQALTDMNVKLVDVNGNYRDTYDIFKDIAAQWDKMSSTDQAALATKLSGTRMQAVFYSLVQNFGEAEKAMEAMGAAEGELTEKNEVFANSIEGRMNQFRNEFKKLATEIFTSDWIKDAVAMARDALGMFAQIAKALTGVVKALGGIRAVLPAILRTYIGFKLAKGVSNLVNLANGIRGITEAGKSLSLVQTLMLKGNAKLAESSVKTGGALKALGGGITSTLKAFVSTPMGAVTAALAAGAVAYEIGYKVDQARIRRQIDDAERANKALDEQKSKASEARTEVEAATRALNDNRDLYTDLVELKPIEYTNDDSLGKLREATAELREQKELAETIAEEEQLKTNRAFGSTMSSYNSIAGAYNGQGSYLGSAREEFGRFWSYLTTGEGKEYTTPVEEAFAKALSPEVIEKYFRRYEGRGETLPWLDYLKAVVGDLTKDNPMENAADSFGGLKAALEGKVGYEYRDFAAIDELTTYIESLLSGVTYIDKPTTEADREANYFYKQLSILLAELKDASVENSSYGNTITAIAKQYGFNTFDEIKQAFEEQTVSSAALEFKRAVMDALPDTLDKSTIQYGDNFVEFVQSGFNEAEKAAKTAAAATDEFGNAADGATGEVSDLTTAAYENAEALGQLGVALKDAGAASGGLDKLDKIYTDIANGGTFDFSSLVDDKFVEEFGNLRTVFTNFIDVVSNSPEDLNACQKAFDDLTTAYILQDKFLGNVDEDTKGVIATLLKEQGVSNATALINEYLAGTYAGIVLQKAEINREEINTSKDVDNLINLATQARMTAESLQKLEQVKSLMSLAGRLLADKGPDDFVYQKLVNRANGILDEWFSEDYQKAIDNAQGVEEVVGVYSGGDAFREYLESLNKAAEDTSAGTSSSAEKIKTWFEEQYAEHKHLVAMEQETDLEYFTWLEDAFKRAYAEGILELDDYRKYEEEVYSGMKKLREAAEKDAQSSIDKLVDIRKKMLEKEVSDQKDALNDQLKNLKDFYDKQKKMLQDSYDEEDYLAEQAEKRKSVSDLEEELARLRYDDSAWAQKRKAELSQQITDARKELDTFERDHARDEALSFLDEQEAAAEEKINSQIESLDQKYKSAKELYEQALADVKNGSVALYQEMIKWNGEYGDGIDDTITSAWESAYQALNDYSTLFGKTFKGFNLANATGYVVKPVGAGYASGTSYATPGLHSIDEKGSETYFSPSTGGKYKMFSGGEKVLTAKASEFLYRFANGGSEMLKKFIASVGGGVLNDRLTPLMTNNEIVMGDVIVNGNADRATVSEIRRAQRESVEFMLKEFGKLNR